MQPRCSGLTRFRPLCPEPVPTPLATTHQLGASFGGGCEASELERTPDIVPRAGIDLRQAAPQSFGQRENFGRHLDLDDPRTANPPDALQSDQSPTRL